MFMYESDKGESYLIYLKTDENEIPDKCTVCDVDIKKGDYWTDVESEDPFGRDAFCMECRRI